MLRWHDTCTEFHEDWFGYYFDNPRGWSVYITNGMDLRCIRFKRHHIHINFHDDGFRYSALLQQFGTMLYCYYKRYFIQYTVEMASGGRIYIPSFIKMLQMFKQY
jgi:hypothetical protein